MKKHSFTLVELLAVIAIIGILSGILIPVVSGVQTRGKITQAKSDMKTIETAIEAFAADNGGRYSIPYSSSTYRWNGTTPSATKKEDKVIKTIKYHKDKTKSLLQELCDPQGSGVTCNNNKRKIRYMEPSKNYQNPGDELWLDPWGTSYSIMLCVNGTGDITPHDTHKLYSSVAIWSWGPNGADNSGANEETDSCTKGITGNKPFDDVASWHK